MASLILVTRGVQQQRNIWKQFMSSQWFNWIRRPLLKNEKGEYIRDEKGEIKKGEGELTRVQGVLRPIELYEYVFPKNGVKIQNGKLISIEDKNLKEVLAMMNLQNSYDNLRPEVQPLLWLLRKGMKLKKIPNFTDIKNKETFQITDKLVPMDGMCVYPAGIKEDVFKDWEEYGFEQEGL